MNLGDPEDPIALTKENALGFLLKFQAVLDEDNVPADGRWIRLPGWTYAPHRSRSGRRSKKRVQKKKVLFPMFLKGTRWMK